MCVVVVAIRIQWLMTHHCRVYCSGYHEAKVVYILHGTSLVILTSTAVVFMNLAIKKLL